MQIFLQCEGDFCFVDLPDGNPPSIDAPNLHLMASDNTAALAHIRKEGGLKGRRLLREAETILILMDSRHLRILPAFIPSEENLQADAASRFQLVPDWHLDPRVFWRISSQIDLFASRQSAHTTRFMSWRAAD
jgi:hypothetical protein